jgi:chromosome segregation ATPase
MDHLKEHMRRYMSGLSGEESGSNILPMRSNRSRGSEPEDLISELADAMKASEDRAARVESQALDVARRAVEELANAEKIIRAGEEARRSCEARVHVAEAATVRLDARTKALEQMLADVQSSVSTLRMQLSESKSRADAAEVQASDAKTALVAFENAIRTRLLGTAPNTREPRAATG